MIADPLVCDLDGNVRRVIASDRYSTTYVCSWCRCVSVEEYEPDVTNDLQREFR
jgi:hypothetical protein